MTLAMWKFRSWLRPPRSLSIVFLLVVGVPAATLIALGMQLLNQDRISARQRQSELLAAAAEEGVRAVKKDVEKWQQWLTKDCREIAVPSDAVCVQITTSGIETSPAGRVPYYPRARSTV